MKQDKHLHYMCMKPSLVHSQCSDGFSKVDSVRSVPSSFYITILPFVEVSRKNRHVIVYVEQICDEVCQVNPLPQMEVKVEIG
jgi:hypothetical protein